jgi:hypothetical protein
MTFYPPTAPLKLNINPAETEYIIYLILIIRN